tara:strand:+ start:120 stop:779 length:660 start_codon:yes stop_codon:yes gene_type:complete
MGVHYHKRPIVTDGLVFQVDAANKLCGNVTDAKNMVNPTELGSFVNGLTVNDNAYSFDGTNDYIVLSNTITNTIYTLDFWYKMGVNDGSYGYFVSSGANGFAISEGGTVVGLSYGEFYYYNGTVSTRLGSSIPSLTEWNNITSIIDTSSNIIKVYGNGSLISNNSISNLSTSVTNIGRYITGNTHFLNGNLSPYKIYNRALSPEEINQNYNALKGRFGL